MSKKNDLFKKNMVKQSYKILSLLIAFVSASALWYYNISPYWQEGYTGYVTLVLVGILFCITYWVFAKMYQAQKIGIYRLTELTYFQILSFGIADVLLVLESVIWFHGIEKLRIGTYLVGFVLQMILTVFNIFVHNRLFARYDEPRKVLIVYGNEEYRSLVKKIKAKKFRYNVVGCYSQDCSFEKIKPVVDECESIYLYEVNSELKKSPGNLALVSTSHTLSEQRQHLVGSRLSHHLY